jgi:hypothetical protein
MIKNYKEELNNRSQHNHNSKFDATVSVENLALINYMIPIERIINKFEIGNSLYIPTYLIDNKEYAAISIAPLLNRQLGFYKLIPILKVTYPEVNFRLYVNEKKDDIPAVFFIKMLTSGYYNILARNLWRMPWFKAQFWHSCDYSNKLKKYTSFKYLVKNDEEDIEIDIDDTGEKVNVSVPFENISQEKLILTHPEHAFYKLNNKLLAHVVAYHKEMNITQGKVNKLYFKFLEDNELLTKEEMMNPHSIFLCRKIPYKVDGLLKISA